MEKKNWAKRIVALGTGALMLGATLTGALADLGDYPAPFVEDGMLQDTVIVVGEAAQTADVLGAVDIAAALQREAVSPVDSGVVVATVDEGVKIEKSGEKLNLGEYAASIQATYDDNDLDMLEDGDFMDDDFSQTLTLGGSSVQFQYASPGKVDKTEFDAGFYTYFPNGVQVYSYSLAMDSTLTSAPVEDVETEVLEIQGNTYTITDISYHATTGAWTKMTLLAGETSQTLWQDQPLTVGDVTVTVVGVNQDEDKCLLNINGVTHQVDVGRTEEIEGLQVGVTDAFAGYGDGATNACEVNLGAREVELDTVAGSSGRVTVNNAEVKGSTVAIVGNNTAETFDSFTITYSMDDDEYEDDMYGPAQYKMPGDEWIDPVFGNFKLVFDSTSAKTEELSFDGSSDEAVFRFNNADGDEVLLDMWEDGSGNIKLGEENGPLLFTAVVNQSGANNASMVSYLDTDTYPDAKLWYVLSNGEVHILEFDDYDDDNAKLEFIDLVSGDDVVTSALSATTGVFQYVTLGSLGSAQIGWNSGDNKLFFNATPYTAETEYGAELSLAQDADNVTLTLVSPDEDSDEQTADETFTLRVSYDTSDEEVDVLTPLTSGTWHANGVDYEYSDADYKDYASVKGVWFRHDDEEKQTLEILYPEEDLYANVFLTPVTASVRSGAGEGAGVDVNPFELKLAVLDSEAEGMDMNMIVVGGPCANTIAAELMGNPTDCAEGFEPGRGMLKIFDRDGKTALLVAGYSADDTRGSAFVLADPDDEYSLSGDEVEVVVASLDQISIA